MLSNIFRPFVNLKQHIANKRYQKYISNFSQPEKSKNEDIKGMTHFDLIDKHSLAGQHTKFFTMIDKSEIEQYLRQAKKKKCHYESYLNQEDIISGNIPHNISTLIKKEHFFEICVEIFGSRVLNFFEVPTSYNFPIKNKQGHTLLGSIDFIKYGEEFFTYAEYNNSEKFDKFDTLKRINFSAKISIDEFSKRHHLFLSKEKKNQLRKELLYSAAVRKILLNDYDFRDGNFGFLYNKKSRTLKNSPNFDFEYFFRGYPNHEKELRWLKENEPKIYEKFKQKFNEFSQKHLYIEPLATLKKEYATKILELIEDQIKNLTRIFNTLEKENLSQQEQ